MFEQLDEVVTLFKDIEERLASSDILKNQPLFQKLSKEHRNLQPVVTAYSEYKSLEKDFAQNKEMIENESGELKEMALEENLRIEPEIKALVHKLRILLLPKDPNDDKNIMIEIRPAAGGG